MRGADVALGVPVSVRGVVRVSQPLHHRVEPAVRSGLVLDDTNGSVGFLEGIGALHVVPVPVLLLLLDVAGVGVVDGVVEVVLGWALEGEDREGWGRVGGGRGVCSIISVVVFVWSAFGNYRFDFNVNFVSIDNLVITLY